MLPSSPFAPKPSSTMSEKPEDGAKHQKPFPVRVVGQKENANQVDLGAANDPSVAGKLQVN